MGRTKRTYLSNWNSSNVYASKKKICQQSHNAHKTHNRNATQLTFQKFSQYLLYNTKRSYAQLKTGNACFGFGNIVQVIKSIKMLDKASYQRNICTRQQSKWKGETLREQLAFCLKRQTHQRGKHMNVKYRTLTESIKQLNRRGTLSPFRGHRKPGQLYKNQTFIEQF